MKKHIFVIPLLCIVFSSCIRQEVVDIGSEEIQSKLVILSYLTPGDSIHVFVNRSIPFGSSASPDRSNVLDATVKLKDQNGNTQLLKLTDKYVPIYSCSQKDLPITPGQTYNLTVSAPGLVVATSRTTVPSEAAAWKSVSIAQTNDGGNEFLGVWDALSDEEDIDYGVFVYRPVEPISLLFGNESITPKLGEYTVKRVIYSGTGSQLEAMLLTRSKALGQFSKIAELTKEMELYYSGAGFYEIVSGFKGVIPKYTNIENGLGIFGSYLQQTVEIK